MIKLLEMIKDILFIFSVPLFLIVFLAIVDFKYESLKRDCESSGGHVVLSERGNYKDCINIKHTQEVLRREHDTTIRNSL